MADLNHTPPLATLSTVAHLLQRAVPLIEDQRSPHLGAVHIRQALLLVGGMLETVSRNVPVDMSVHGAEAAARALQHIQDKESAPNPEQTAPEFFHEQDEAMAAALQAAGPLSPYQDGFVRALVEFAQSSMRSGIPDLDVWKPEAAMTAREKVETRLERSREIEDVLAG